MKIAYCPKFVGNLSFFSFFWILTLSFQPLVQTLAEPQLLAPNQTFECEMKGSETHRYKFDLKKDEFFQVRVEQKDIDVFVKLFDENRKLVVQRDSPNLEFGFEILSWISKESGNYQIEISPYEDNAKSGKYKLKRIESRTSLEPDKERLESETLLRDIIKLYSAKEKSEEAKIIPL